MVFPSSTRSFHEAFSNYPHRPKRRNTNQPEQIRTRTLKEFFYSSSCFDPSSVIFSAGCVILPAIGIRSSVSGAAITWERRASVFNFFLRSLLYLVFFSTLAADSLFAELNFSLIGCRRACTKLTAFLRKILTRNQFLISTCDVAFWVSTICRRNMAAVNLKLCLTYSFKDSLVWTLNRKG